MHGALEYNFYNGADIDRDTLTRGTGADKFFFRSRDGEGFIGIITDFVVADDTISVDAEFFGNDLTPGAPITPEQFTIGTVANAPSNRFIYNQDSGSLFFDYDGTGMAG